jgi:hypothetical protein
MRLTHEKAADLRRRLRLAVDYGLGLELCEELMGLLQPADEKPITIRARVEGFGGESVRVYVAWDTGEPFRWVPHSLSAGGEYRGGIHVNGGEGGGYIGNYESWPHFMEFLKLMRAHVVTIEGLVYEATYGG